MVVLNEKTIYDSIRKCKVVKKIFMSGGNTLPSTLYHPEDSDVVFRFRFSPKSVKDNFYDYAYRVYAFKREDMDLFLKQHGFDTRLVHIECIPINEFDDDDDHFLKSFKFRSNTSAEIYNIMTTDHFIKDAIDYTCAQLSDTLVFGPPIVRNDIEIIRLINDLMFSIPHAFILDHTLTDGFTGEPYSKDWEKYIKFYNPYQSLEDMDDSYIYESIHNNSIDDLVQPITIEAYVSNFTQMILDSFNDEPF